MWTKKHETADELEQKILHKKRRELFEIKIKNKEKSKDNYEIEKREENVKTADEICNGN